MPQGLTSTIVVNTALELINAQTTITSLTDGSTAANAAAIVYPWTVQLMLRELDPDFARFTAPLAQAASPSNQPWWAYEYVYPADCVRLRQLRPPAGQYDVNDPYPVLANVALDTINGLPTRVILSNLQDALAVYTTSNATEAQWDSVFTDAVARRLGNPLALALSGRMDSAEKLLEQASQVAMTGGAVDESSFKPF